MEIYNVRSQWLKGVVLANNLPPLIKAEVKETLRKPRAQAGPTIYKDLKAKVMKLFGKKEGERYEKASQMLLTGKPSKLAKEITELLCTCDPPLQCCQAETVAGMWKKQLPTQVKAAIAGLSLRDDYEGVLDKADDVWSTLPGRQAVAAVAEENWSEDDPEVAAFGARAQRGQSRGGRGGRNQGRGGRAGQRGQGRGGQGYGQGYGQGRGGYQQQRSGAPPGSCPTHMKFGKNAWKCTSETCPWKEFTTTPPQ